MTISTTNIKNSYTGNGSTSAFTYTFKITDDDDIQVIIRSASGTETVKTKTTHYTVAGVNNAGGGTITFTAGNIPTSTQTVILRRSTPQTQELDLIANSDLPSDSLENSYDKLTLIAQELQEQIDRSIKLSRTNEITSTEFIVGATDRANKILAFDSSGEIAVTQELGTYRGNWLTATSYYVRDLIKDTSNNNIYICNTAHTSAGSQPLSSNVNSTKYTLIVDAASATTSQTAAAASAAAALASENAASSSAASASSSASAASSSASAASASASASASSAASAATSFDDFDDRYLGSKSSAPTLDNDGNALLNGALYWNTTSAQMFVRDSGSWVAIKPTITEQGYINTVAGNSTNINSVAANSTNINAVATNVANINTVAGNNANINTVASANSNITTVAGANANITAVASQITPTNNISTVAGNTTNINTVAGNNANITTVAGVSGNVTSVANSIANVNTVASNIANVNTVATNNTNINTVASQNTNITTLAGISSDITAVANISSDIQDVQDKLTELQTVANDLNEVTSEIDTVANAITNIDNVGNNIANVNTVAGQISPTNNISTVASANANISSVATNIANVNLVGGSITNVNTVANNLTGVNSFAERYRVASSDPATSLDAGDLVFNTNASVLKYYDGSSWQTVTTGGISDVVQDGSPQLGGNLDVNGYTVVSTSNANINITPNGTGKVVLSSIPYPNSLGTSGQALVVNNAQTALEFSTIQASEITTVGNYFSNWNEISSNLTTTTSTTKNMFLCGEMIVSGNAVWTIAGNGTLTII